MNALLRSIGLVLIAVVGFGGVSAVAAQQEAGTVRANVIICADPDCVDTVNIETMYGATVTSYHADGSVVDSCTVTQTQADMVDCTIVPAPVGGSYGVEPTAEYSGYVLQTTEPEVFQSEMHGPVYVWYFAHEKDNLFPPPTQVPAAPVSELPSTGSGSSLESGVTGTLTTSFDLWDDMHSWYVIYGTEGTIRLPDPNFFGGPVKLYDGATREWRDLELVNEYVEDSRGIGVADMARALREGGDHRASGALGFHVLEVMLGALESGETRQTVEIESSVERPAAL